jgi:hypothetical protein
MMEKNVIDIGSTHSYVIHQKTVFLTKNSYNVYEI